MSRPPRNPTNWDEYQYGTSHRGSIGSEGGRSVQFDDGDRQSRASIASSYRGASDEERHADQNLRRRRSSVALRLNAIAQVGGVNSIANFARSWQRAAGFHEVAPHRPSFVLPSDDEAVEEDGVDQYSRAEVPNARLERVSLLRQHLEASPVDEEVIEDDGDEGVDAAPLKSPLESEADKYRLGSEAGTRRDNQSFLATAPHLVTQLSGSYGTSYGTLRSVRRESSMAHAGQLWHQQHGIVLQQEGEHQLLLVKEVEQEGRIVLAVAGQSTLPQTVFNATNVLIGVGLLSLPLGIKYAGLIYGMGFLFFAALITSYTALLLAKCLDLDASLITFADLAFISFGQKARIVTGILFMLELLAACVALVVLFADTLAILVPTVGVTEWKIICGILMIPLNFVPLRLLSFSSVLGIFSCFSIVLIVFVNGFAKPHAPGSLREPAQTYLFPENWLTLPVSFGILMSPFGGHSIFGNIYRDMRHPQKYAKAVKITFSFTYILDAATAMAGILMFGDDVRDEITSNIIGNSGYPEVLSIVMTIFIAIIPLTKLPLNARPIVSTIEAFTGLDHRTVSDNLPHIGLRSRARGALKLTVRILVIIIFVIISILFPSFDSIMAFMGSALCFTICVILPMLFHLKLFGNKISTLERAINYVMIVLCSILAVTGTVFAFLPKSMIGAG